MEGSEGNNIQDDKRNLEAKVPEKVPEIPPQQPNSNIIPLEPISNPNGKSKFIWKIIPIILILIMTAGLILYFVLYHTPDLEEESFNEGYLTGQSEALNNSQYYNLGLNDGYIIGQEEIITIINTNAQIPIIFNQSGNLTVSWISLQQICTGGT